MKRLSIAFSTLLILILFTAPPASAQHGQQGMMQEGMMGQGMQGSMMQMMRGMHQQMMQNPMHRASMMAFMLPALADTLGLSEEQTSQLEELRSELQAQRQEHQQQMAAQRQELMSLFEGDGQPDPAEVRTRLQEAAQLRAEGQAATYETAQAMREVLTDEQRQMLEEMTPQEQMRQMMRRMPMMDMMQMMQQMRGDMMGGGMMQQNRQNQ